MKRYIANLANVPVAALLFFAAFMKLLEQSSFPLSRTISLDGIGGVSLAFAEIFGGLLLLSGSKSRYSKLFALFLFLFFIAFNTYRTIYGFKSCGCFGAIKVNPSITLFIDLIGLLLLYCWQPKKNFEFRTAVTLCLTVCFALATWLVIVAPEPLVSKQNLNENSIYFLEVEKWKGEIFPVDGHVIGDQDLMKGNWRVIFFRNDCDHCQKLLYDLFSGPQPTKTALVNVDQAQQENPESIGKVHWFRLDQSKTWIIKTPSELTLVDGVVTSIAI